MMRNVNDEDRKYFNECENEYFDSLDLLQKRIYLEAKLRYNILVIDYTKKDGKSRALRGTLISDFLPVVDENKTAKENQSPVESTPIALWDVNAKGWRSILVSGVNSFILVEQ